MTRQDPLMDSFRSGTPKRTMGSETEYTTRISRPLMDRVDHNLVAHYNFDDELWMKNGARMYMDYGKMVEYATPECMSGSHVLLHERIGQLTVRNVGDMSAQDITVDPLTDELHVVERRENVYKRTGYGYVEIGEGDDTVVKRSDLSTGHHETYQTGLSEEELSEHRGFLYAYLATRVVWSGAGLVAADGYHLSQKADAIDFHDGDDLVYHGKKIPYRYKGGGLVELRTGEGNMSDWAVIQKFDMTSLVFRMIEHGEMPKDNLVSAGFETAVFRAASRDPLAPVPSDYERLDAVDVQRIIAEQALAFAAEHDVPRHEVNAAKQVLQACQDIHAYYFGEANLSAISDRIDWAAKLAKLQARKLSLGDITCSNLVAVAHDLSWEDTSREGAAARWYGKRKKSVFDESDLRRNAMIPPTDRARKRVDFIEDNIGDIQRVDWDVISLKNDEIYYV